MLKKSDWIPVPQAIIVRLHGRKINVVIFTPETAAQLVFEQ